MVYKDILKVVPITQSLSLLNESAKDYKKKFKPAKSTLSSIIGIELIKSTGNLI